MLHRDHHTDYTRELEQLSCEICQIGHCEDKHRLQYADMIREPSNEASQIAYYDPDKHPAYIHNEELKECEYDIIPLEEYGVRIYVTATGF